MSASLASDSSKYGYCGHVIPSSPCGSIQYVDKTKQTAILKKMNAEDVCVITFYALDEKEILFKQSLPVFSSNLKYITTLYGFDASTKVF